jgi:hypothetical protein
MLISVAQRLGLEIEELRVPAPEKACDNCAHWDATAYDPPYGVCTKASCFNVHPFDNSPLHPMLIEGGYCNCCDEQPKLYTLDTHSCSCFMSKESDHAE